MTEPNLWWEEPETTEPNPIRMHHRVIAILVNHNGKVWLAEALRALDQQYRPADLTIAVDLGSEDGSEKLLRVANPKAPLLELPADAGLTAALAAAELEADTDPSAIEWLWILHDDSAAEPRALRELLKVADRHPHASVIGSKVTGWRDPNHVLEVGTAYTAIGTRFTGLEHGERDQGQHDSVQPVMAVNSAGMLVRRDTWRALNGFSNQLDHFRTDMEFCLRVWENGGEVLVAPAARIRHAAATARGMRKVAGHRGTSHFIDRYAGLMVSLSRTPRGWLWLRWLLILSAGGVRALGYLALQDLRGARDEFSASVAALGSRRKVLSMRHQAGSGNVPRELRPTFKQQFSHVASETLSTLNQTWNNALDWLMPERVHVGEVGFWRAVRAAVSRPGAVISLATLTAGLWLVWPAVGDGALTLPNGEVIPNAANALLGEYLSAWHPVGFGSTLAAHPLQGIVGILGLLYGGDANFLKMFLALSVWAVAMSMHLSLRKLVVHAPTRVWLAALYAFSPPVLQAVVSGDVGTILCAVLLPVLLVIAPRISQSWRVVAVAGIITAVVFAVWPVLWLACWLLIAIGYWQQRPAIEVLLRWVMVPIWAFLLLLPWSVETLSMPARWFHQFGAVRSGNALAGAALFGISDSAHPFNWFWSIGLLVVAFAAWVDRRNRSTHRFLWVGVVVVLGLAAIGQIAASLLDDANVQPSLALASVICVGLLIATTASATGFVRVRLARTDFGWRQLSALLVGLVVTLMPIGALVANGLTPDADRVHLQSAKTAEMLRGFTEDLRLRTLWLSSGESAQVEAAILDGRTLWFGDHAVMDTSDEAVLAQAIVEWLTRSGETAANPLRRFGIGYVAVPFGDSVAKRVAAMGGLKRLLTARNENLISVWQATDVQSRAFIGDGIEPAQLLLDISPAPSVPDISGVIVPQETDTAVVLADRAAESWSATLNGSELKRIDSLELRWEIPQGANGELRITYPTDQRGASLVLSGMTLAILILTLLPRRKYSYQEEWLDD